MKAMERMRWLVSRASPLPLLALVACSSGSDPSDAAPWIEKLGADIGTTQITTSPAGAIALTGQASGQGRVGGRNIDAASGSRTFFAGLDPHGRARWLNVEQEAARAQGLAMAFDALGGCVTVGSFEGGVDFGLGNEIALAQDTFVVRRDASGKATWVRHFSADDGGPEGTGSSLAAAVAADEAGGVVFAGSFTGTIGFGGAGLETSGQGAFVAKLDAAGRHVWSRRLGGSSDDYIGHLALDAGGAVFLSGVSGSSTGIDALSQPDEPPGGSAFITKLGSEGSERWRVPIESSQLPEIAAVLVDSAGDVTVAGTFRSDVRLGAFALSTSVETRTPFVAKLSSQGSPVWLHDLDIGDGQAMGAAIDSSGRVYVGGSQTASGMGLTGFLRQLDDGGEVVKQWRFGNDDSFIFSVQPLGSDLLLGGHFVRKVDVGGEKLSTETDGLFLARFRP